MKGLKNKALSALLSLAMVASMLSPMSAQAATITSGDEYVKTANGLEVKLTAVIDGENAAIAADNNGAQTSTDGNLADVFDGNAYTGVIFRTDKTTWDGYSQPGDYIQVDFKEAIDLNSVNVNFGHDGDTFKSPVLAYTTGNDEWTTVTTAEGLVSSISYTAEEKVAGVTAIKVTNNVEARTRQWVRLAEITVDGTVAEVPVVTPEPTPVVTPEPTPVVTPEPTPVVTPDPTPVVTPDPTPVVTPDPTPEAPEVELLEIDSAVLASNAKANSEQLPIAWVNDGGAEWAFDEEAHWWHSRYQNWDQKAEHEIGSQEGDGKPSAENPIWIQTGFDEVKYVAEITYLPRQNGHGVIRDYAVSVANLADPTANPADDDFTVVKEGTLEPTKERQTIALDEAVAATHVRITVTSTYKQGDGAAVDGDGHLAAQNIKIYEVKVEAPKYDIEVSERVDEMIEGMSLKDKVTQMLMVDFRKWGETTAKATDFTVMNDQVQKIVEDYNFGSVIFFANNIKETEQSYNLSAAMQEAATKDGGIALLIAADQEGGSVYRLGSGTALPGNMALGATFDTENSYKAGKIIGSELMAVGINTNLAPVVDVNNNANNPVIGLRSYGDDATAVGEMASASIAGMAEFNVIGCAKHFPGHGDTATDSHYGLPSVDKPYDVLKDVELKPYEVAIEEGIEMIMTAHILYPQLESDKIVSNKTGEAESLPATMSDDILTGLLKGDMGFDGIIVTDAMNMDGISGKWDQVQSVVIAFQAGVDMICMPCQLYCEADLANLDAIINGVIAAVEAGEIPMSRIDNAVARILTVKENRGILDYKAEDHTLEKALEVVGSDENRATEREIAAKAVTVIKNENNTLPLELTADSKVLMLVPYNNERSQMLMAWNRAKEAGIIPYGAEVDYYTFSRYTKMDTADFAEKLAWANIVIINSEISSAAKMAGANTTAALTSTTFLAAIPTWVTNYCKENGKVSVISSVDKPYDVQLYPNADAIVAAYGCKGSSVDPTEALIGGATGSKAAYGPNIIAAVEVILGTFPAQGKLPVTIPVFDAATKSYTDVVAFERGYGLTFDAKEAIYASEADKQVLFDVTIDYTYTEVANATEESLAAADAAFAKATEILAKDENLTQYEVLAAADALTAAIAALEAPAVEKEVDSAVLVANAKANSEQLPVAWDNDGGAAWAFDDEAHWWHSRYQGDPAEHETANGQPSEENPIWIQTGFGETLTISKLTYLPRQGSPYGRIKDFTVSVATVENPTDDDFTVVKTGTLENVDTEQEIVLDEAVEATHVRITVTSVNANGGTAEVAAQKIKVFAVEKGEVTLKARKENLVNYLAELEELDLTAYTEESVAAFEAARAAAQAVVADETVKGIEVYNAYVALGDAFDALEVSVPTVDPADDTNDVPVDMYTTSAGSTYNSTDYAIDGSSSTHWEVQWDIGATEPEKLWYQIDMGQEIEIDAVRYLPRFSDGSGNQNGFIQGYRIEVSVDGENWTTAAEGEWEMTGGWKLAEFEAVTARYVKLVGTKTYADVDSNFGNEDEVNSNMSIAEIRVKATVAGDTIINKADLNKAIEAAKALVAEDYKDMTAVDAALAAAEAVAANAEATQEEVDAAAAALTSAMEALVKVVKKAALVEAIAAAKEIVQDLYTSATAAALADAIAAGEALVADEEATQAAVDAAVKAIEKATKALEAKATAEEKAALEAAVAEAEAIDVTVYTEESAADLAEAIESAKEVLADADATADDVEDAMEDLEDAIAALEEPEEPKPEVCEVFPDVKHGAWYEVGVQFVYDAGLMSGSNGLFNPTSDITRAQIVTTLYRLAGEPEVTDTKALTDFTDVAEGKYYTDAVCWAYANGVATGNDGKFDPTGKLTRQQMAAFFFRFADVMGMDTTVRGDYSSMVNADKVSGYAAEPMAWAVGAGLISGSDVTVDGVAAKDLNPRGNTTRAQVATILMRFCAE